MLVLDYDNIEGDFYVNNIFLIKMGCRFIFIYNGIKKFKILEKINLSVDKAVIKYEVGYIALKKIN